jgi:hypothetical protein
VIQFTHVTKIYEGKFDALAAQALEDAHLARVDDVHAVAFAVLGENRLSGGEPADAVSRTRLRLTPRGWLRLDELTAAL